MKKYLLLLPTAILPYYILLTLFVLIKTISEHLLTFLFFGLWVLIPLSLICSIVWLFRSIAHEQNTCEAAKAAMMLKLIHIPAYLLIFLCSLLFLITIFTAGLSLVLLLLDAITITASGLIGLAAVLRCKDEHLLTGKAALLQGLLQFVFCIDIISIIWIYRKTQVSGDLL